MRISTPKFLRAGVFAVALGTAIVPAVTAAAPAEASSLTATCGVVNTGPIGASATCWGSGAATLTVYCTNGTAWGLVFAPATITVRCPPGGTMIRFTLG